MTSVRTPEAAAHIKETAALAAELKQPATNYIDKVVGIFRQANDTYPYEDNAHFAYGRIASDDPRSYRGDPTRRSSDVFAIGSMIAHVRKSRGKPTISRSYENKRHEFDSPLEKKYSDIRSLAASGLQNAIEAWDQLSPEKAAFVESNQGWNFVEEWQNKSRSAYFHDVLVADMLGTIPQEHIHPFGVVVQPTFIQEENGKRLMEATLRVMHQISTLANKPDVESELHGIKVADLNMARVNDNYGDINDERKIIQNTGTRQLVEATWTTNQVASLLLAGVKDEFDITAAVTSLEKNGTFKLFSIFPMGVIGPMAVNGTRWNPEYVLDQDMLRAGEFAVHNELRRNIIDTHIWRRTSKIGLLARQNSEDDLKGRLKGGVSLGSLGCPASAEAIKFVTGLLIEELHREPAFSSLGNNANDAS